MDIKKLVTKAHEQSTKSGFWSEGINRDDLALKIALMHSEVSEALEEYRMRPEKRGGELSEILYENVCSPVVGQPHERLNKPKTENCDDFSKCKHKPAGFVVELADCAIRIFDLVGHLQGGELLQFQMSRPRNAKAESIGWRLCWIHERLSFAFGSIGEVSKDSVIVYLSHALAECEELARDVGGDLWNAIEIKMAYNATRPFMHGKVA